MIVVLDSGIWISAFQFGGSPQTVSRFVFSDHTSAICDQITQVVCAVLTRKFAWKEEERLAILRDYDRGGFSVEIAATVQGVCRDPKNDMVLECAAKLQAEIIVSGDKDLAELKAYRGIPVLTARQYLDKITPLPA